MRNFLYRILAALNGMAKRLLGVREHREAAPLAPDYFDALQKPANYAAATAPGAWVFVIHWVARGSGGLSDMLHLGAQLESKFGLNVFYISISNIPEAEVWERLHWSNPLLRREQILGTLDFVPEFLCATSWPTAYRVRELPSQRKMYFVQDYEPLFHKAGVARHYAAKTYELGLEMFTLGTWLAGHIARQHGVSGLTPAPFPVGDELDAGPPLARRKVIAVYVQPNKEHRGTDLLLEGLRRFIGRHPSLAREMEIVLFGSLDNEYMDVDLPCAVRGVLTEKELASLILTTRVGVCASFTNVSLLTLRWLAAGCVTLDLAIGNVTENVPACAGDLFVPYAPDPDALAAALARACARDLGEDRRRAISAAVVAERNWSCFAESMRELVRRGGHNPKEKMHS